MLWRETELCVKCYMIPNKYSANLMAALKLLLSSLFFSKVFCTKMPIIKLCDTKIARVCLTCGNFAVGRVEHTEVNLDQTYRGLDGQLSGCYHPSELSLCFD